MAYRRTTVVLTPEDERALREAARAEGLSQSELIRKGISLVTGRLRSVRAPSVGWLKLSRRERKEILEDRFGDRDR